MEMPSGLFPIKTNSLMSFHQQSDSDKEIDDLASSSPGVKTIDEFEERLEKLQ